jgi:hypothetical protein
MTATARARETAFGGEVELRFPYREALVDDLKREIPGRFRRWDADEKRWLILGAYAPAAVDLLLEYFPNAQVPGDQPRRLPSTPARTAKPPTPVPLPPIPFPVAPDPNDQPAPLVASVRCPRCHTRYEQAIRVVAESSRTVAKQERPPAEFLTVCPRCNELVVVGFVPAPTLLREVSA